ncbi:MAG: glycosyltransferase family 4 protein [Blautia sp.]|uniref:glycosyltransferase family 4 protein n=1 Tax=Blautia sp. TaxID=1955243 RepID=UPI002E7A990F|nr:glycosyltransferase family 4 protein [Blautia sp.]MEE1442832.1 glycosyltransferase family 4 protein [Blautia sp.]
MKILITTDWYKPIVNGVVTSVLNLKKELEERGHEVRVLTLSRDYHSYEEDGVYYIKSVNLEKIYPNVRAVLPHREAYIQELIQWNPDVVHSQCEFMTFSYAVKISRKCNCPLLHTYHTIYEDYLHYLPGTFFQYTKGAALEKKMVAKFSKAVLKKTQQVIAPTKKVEELLKNYEVSEPISVIPTGIDLKRFQEVLSKEERNRRREALGISQDSKVLVSIGRLAKEKNLEEILIYFQKLTKEELTFKLKLLIVGDGPDRERLEGIAKTLQLQEKVIFTGMVTPEEVAQYYQLGDVFVCASNSETQGITYIEALASGIPALCRKDACLDSVITDGYNGFQYETYEFFKMHLQYILEREERRVEMGVCARQTAKLYSTWNFCTMAERLYKEAIVSKERVQVGTTVENLRLSFSWSRRNILRRGA